MKFGGITTYLQEIFVTSQHQYKNNMASTFYVCKFILYVTHP